MYKTIATLAGVTSLLFISGCASIVNGTNQPLSVKTAPFVDANCELKNDKGEWYIHQTPGSVTVHRSYTPLNINCRKGQYYGHEMIQSKTKGMAFGNVLFGGVIGAGVDVANGSAYDYPDVITIPMRRR